MRHWDHNTIYTITEDEHGYLEALILSPKNDLSPALMSGPETVAEMEAEVRYHYGSGACYVSDIELEEELHRRQQHSPEMLALLQNNPYGLDFSGRYVYAAVIDPLDYAPYIGDDVYLLNPLRRQMYQQYTVKTLAVSRMPISKEVCDHFNLVFLSRP